MQDAMTGGAATTQPVLAGFWWRVLAALIDGLVLMIPGMILQTVVVMIFGAPTVDENGVVTGGGMSTLVNAVLGIAMYWIYFAKLESSEWQATVGKKVLGLFVTDEAGQRLDFTRASIRYFSKILSSLILCIGYIMVAFTAKKQGLHDMIAKTLVYKR